MLLTDAIRKNGRLQVPGRKDPSFPSLSHFSTRVNIYMNPSHLLCWHTVAKTEIIVVDDGSTDPKTELYLREVVNLSGKVRIVRQANQGLSGARNSGIDAATGQFIQLLDADDILIPGKLDVQVAHMNVCPAIDVSISDFLVSDETVTHITRSDAAISRFPLTLDDFLYRWERGFAIPIHCALFRKKRLLASKV